MLQSLVSLLPLVNSVDGGNRRRGRGGRSHRRQPVSSDAGKWIWIDHPDPIRNYYLYARKLFNLSSAPAEAIIKATADSKYKLFVNGHYVGKGPVRSGSGYVYFDEYDIAQYLGKGKNVIAFLVHHIGENTYGYEVKRAGLLCKAEIRDGEETQIIVTDETWRVHRADAWTDAGARLSRRLGFQEVYDASGTIEGWNEVKFGEKGWNDASVVGVPPSDPWGELMPREIPQLREEIVLPRAVVGTYNSPDRPRTVTPAEVPDIMAEAELGPLKAGSAKDVEALLTEGGKTEVKTPRGDRGVVILLDFGTEVSGNVEIGIAGSGTGCIDLGYAELLEDDRVKPNKAGVKYTDRLLLKKGRLNWQGFEPRGFRYMQMEFRWCSKPVSIEYVRVNQTTYPAELKSTFECSDPLLNDIWKIGARTTLLCMEDTFIDCPWRERAQWWGDARIEARVAYYAFDDTALLAQGLRQLAGSQTRDGWIAGMYPAGEEKLLPDFALLWVFSLLDYFGFTDDADLLRDLYPNVKNLLKWFESFAGEYGLLTDVPGWVFIDWADLEKRGQMTAMNCLYYQGLRVANVVATVIGHDDDAQAYADRANALRLSINKYLYSPVRGMYAEGRMDGKLVDKYSRQTNILAALFDIADHYQKASILRQALGGSLPEIVTPYFTSYLLEALYANDRHEDALSVIRRKWGAMLRAGATTFWEQFNEEGSLCHGWSACPTRDLLAEYVGIKPVLGAHRFTIEPHPAGLRWARGSINTRTGPLTVDWRVARNSMTINVTVPEGLRVDVFAPSAPADITKVSVDGKQWPSRFVTLGSGEHRVRVSAVQAPKPAALDESLTPRPVPHVELLEEVSIRARRQMGIITRRHTRPRRERPSKTTVEVVPSDEMEMTEIIPEPTHGLESEMGERAETVAETEKRRRRPRRRGGRGRGRSVEAPVAETDERQEAPVAETAEPVSSEFHIEEQPEDQGEQRPRSRRRPSRRGGRGRSRSSAAPETAGEPGPAEAGQQHTTEAPHAEPAPAQPQIVEPAQPAEAQPSDQEETKPKSRRRPSRRGGRGRRSSSSTDQGAETAPDEPVSAEPAAPEPSPSAEPHAAQPEGQKPSRRRPTRRGGRGRRSSRKPEEGGRSAPENPAPDTGGEA